MRPLVSFRIAAAVLISTLLGGSPIDSQTTAAVARKGRAGVELRDFKIERPNFVVTGENLGKVEVWLWSTGTGITEPGLIGTAKRITKEGRREKWILRIPPDLLAVEIFATAFDKAGNVIGKTSLRYKGASAIYDALYGKK